MGWRRRDMKQRQNYALFTLRGRVAGKCHIGTHARGDMSQLTFLARATWNFATFCPWNMLHAVQLVDIRTTCRRDKTAAKSSLLHVPSVWTTHDFVAATCCYNMLLRHVPTCAETLIILCMNERMLHVKQPDGSKRETKPLSSEHEGGTNLQK